MISLRRLSIPKKIVAITMIITAAALLVASAALIGYDYIDARNDLRASTTTLARIAADELAAAVSFNDRAAAADVLSALRAERSIVMACVYSDTSLFAEYATDPQSARCPAAPPAGGDRDSFAAISTPIQLKGKDIGMVYLRATLGPTYAQLRLEVAIIAIILLIAGVFAFALSARFHKLVSEPILSLARAASEVSQRKDYSLRVPKQTDDEIGTLVDSFNEMLRQIRARETDLEHRTIELEKALEELQRAGKMKDEFLATLSHELRTPLTAIFGWINLLQSGKLDHERTAKAIEVIDRSARAQMKLVNDLLNVSQIVTGKLKIRPEWTDAGTIIRTAVDSIQPAAAAKGVPVVTEIANGAEPVFADAERLQQVLWNLLSNAIKFSERGEEVQVECGRVGTHFQISIRDCGEGIDPEFIPYVFERFMQADASATRKHGGLGLGLAIVRHIIESHGGNVMAYSRGKGQGATFTVQLPVPAIQKDSAVSPESTPASLKGLKVMLVEDEFDTREMVAEGLEQSGATVLLAASGAEALRVLARQTPDVLISDIGMPEMDGYELLEKIRSEYAPNMRPIPAVALTAFATEQERERSFEAGYQVHLAKPVTISELVRTVASIVKRTTRPP